MSKVITKSVVIYIIKNHNKLSERSYIKTISGMGVYGYPLGTLLGTVAVIIRAAVLTGLCDHFRAYAKPKLFS